MLNGKAWYCIFHVLMTQEFIVINVIKISTKGIKCDALLPVLRSLWLT